MLVQNKGRKENGFENVVLEVRLLSSLSSKAEDFRRMKTINKNTLVLLLLVEAVAKDLRHSDWNPVVHHN